MNGESIDLAPSRRTAAALAVAVLTLATPALYAGDVPAVVRLGKLPGPDGKLVDLVPPAGGLAVLIFYSTECPISNAYSPTINGLVETFKNKPATWTGICVDPDLSDDDVRAHAEDFGLRFRLVRDPKGGLGKKLGATMSPEAFVIDAKGKVRYHGRIDDQFLARRQRNAHPSGGSELRDAVADVLAGREVKVPFVPAVGCPIPR